MESVKAYRAYMKNSPHVPLRQIQLQINQRLKKGESRGHREGVKSVVGLLERMKRGGGTKGLDDKSSGMEIFIAEAFAKIKPTYPLILAKQAARRKRK